MPNRFNRLCLVRFAFLLAMFGALGFDSTLLAQQRIEIVEAHLGFGGRYKVGCWTPLVITLRGGSERREVMPRVQFPDGDGQITQIAARPISLDPGQEETVEMLVRIGQLDAGLLIDVIDDQGRRVAKGTFETNASNPQRVIEWGDAGTSRHLLSVGPGDVGLKLPPQEGSNQQLVSEQLLRVESVELLPKHYLAYEGVDTVLLTTSGRETWTAIRADDARLEALATWVELGGRLILFCGTNGGAVLGNDGPLARFSPGTFVGMETLTDLRQIELYSGSNDPFPKRAQTQLSVPHLTDVRGDVELWGNVGEVKLPLVVRARHGLGQVVFAGFDPDIPPFRDWAGRGGVLSRLVVLRDETLGAEQEDYYYDYSGDLSETLQDGMERQLETAGVTTPPFLAIVGLVLLYIALIGPGDYLLVRYVFKRMEWTWVTFPVIVVATSLGAYWLANRMKGSDLITTQVELVDIDSTRGLVRGTLWTHLFSPRPDSYTLVPGAKLPDGAEMPTRDEAVAWLGRPSVGIGGMNTTAMGSFMAGVDYQWTPNRGLLDGVPIEVWSTRTFVSRWYGEGQLDLSSSLRRTTAAGVVGTVTNRSETELEDVVLVYQGYVWRLGSLPAGETASLEPPGNLARSSSPRKVRTWFEEDFQLTSGEQAYVRRQRLSQLPLYGLVNVMMFADAAGGRKVTGAWNRYQQFVDLSHALDSDTAMLVGRVGEPRSELLRVTESSDGQPEATSMRGPRDRSEVIYRIVLPVGPVERPQETSSEGEPTPEESAEPAATEEPDASEPEGAESTVEDSAAEPSPDAPEPTEDTANSAEPASPPTDEAPE